MRVQRKTVLTVVGVIVGFAALAGIAFVALNPRVAEKILDDTQPAASWAPPGPLPVAAAKPTRGTGGQVDPAWALRVSQQTGIPEQAVLAYAGAALVKAKSMPGCGLSWTTLAALGKVESDHGRHNGSSIGPDGTVSPPIYGVALDGNGTVLIPDSDHGKIDGDPNSDRAVGPMQLIPEAWRNWHVDANGDYKQDPQNIYDAALATTNYLCRASTALNTEAGWRAAIAAYNSPPAYLAKVAAMGVLYNNESAP
jgi:membrane-bound lytic murein transglycosylase B